MSNSLNRELAPPSRQTKHFGPKAFSLHKQANFFFYRSCLFNIFVNLKKKYIHTVEMTGILGKDIFGS